MDAEVHGTRRQAEPVYRETMEEHPEVFKWSGRVFEWHQTAGAVVSAGASGLTNLRHLKLRIDGDKAPGKVRWRRHFRRGA